MWARRVTPTRRATRGIVHSRQGQETGYDGALAFALPLLGNSWGRGVTSIADSSLIGICRQGPRCGRRFPCHWYDLVRLHSAGLLVAAFTNQQIAEGVSAPEDHIPWTKGCIRLRDGLQSYHCRPPADCTGGDTLAALADDHSTRLVHAGFGLGTWTGGFPGTRKRISSMA